MKVLPHDSRYCGGPEHCGYCRATLAVGTGQHLLGRYIEIPEIVKGGDLMAYRIGSVVDGIVIDNFRIG